MDEVSMPEAVEFGTCHLCGERDCWLFQSPVLDSTLLCTRCWRGAKAVTVVLVVLMLNDNAIGVYHDEEKAAAACKEYKRDHPPTNDYQRRLYTKAFVLNAKARL